MMSPDSLSDVAKAEITEAELEREMVRVTEAIRCALSGLMPGSCLVIDDVLSAFNHVQRVSEMRRLLQIRRRPQCDIESGESYSRYRNALVDWHHHLPELRGWLLSERSRLGSRSGHAQRVREWVNASQDSLSFE